MNENKKNDTLHTILSKNPSQLFQSIKQIKSQSNSDINQLKVGENTFIGDSVADGFFSSLSSLKSVDSDALNSDSTFEQFSTDYSFIKDICDKGDKLPVISLEKASELLHQVKSKVNDFYSITALHFINGGPDALKLFCTLLNALISDITSVACPELNTVYANILYKGHGKEKTSDTSYRTISTCPLIAKILDLYIRELSLSDWEAVQAETQFQGRGMSHEMSALLLTECIQYSKIDQKKPIFALYLDAKSAFDKALFEILGRRLYLDGTQNHRLSFILQRLENRITFCEWNKILMGPIHDELGVEQGGVNSSDYYKIINNEQLSVPQDTDFGVNLSEGGDIHIASIGQADDTVLLSNDLHNLQFLLHLTLNYCKKYHIELSATKTKLQVYIPSELSNVEEYIKNSLEIEIDTTPIKFVDTAEHVGVIRSVDGNLPHILNRMSSHNKAIHSVLPVGIARHHRGNPAASLRVEKLFGVPVFLSGTASLVLKQSELNMLDIHYKKKLESLQKLHQRTPDCVVLFLAGSLPARALLHLRQLSMFSMITRLPSNILNKTARYILTTARDSSKSWFIQIRDICRQYQLPHPLTMLYYPPSKDSAKSLFKSKVVDYWQEKLRQDASKLPSLVYFKPQFMSLLRPHPLWSTCGSNSYEICKSIVQGRMLSSRYRTDKFVRHFTDCDGSCQLCQTNVPGSIEHLLLSCSSLTTTRDKLMDNMIRNSDMCETSKSLVNSAFLTEATSVQILLDCSTMPDVIAATQAEGTYILEELFRFSRSWCYSIHKTRLKLLGRWNNIS